MTSDYIDSKQENKYVCQLNCKGSTVDSILQQDYTTVDSILQQDYDFTVFTSIQLNIPR